MVTLSKEQYVLFYFSSLYTYGEGVAASPVLAAEQAAQRAVAYLKPEGRSSYEPQTEPVVWAGDNRELAPCWKYRACYAAPMGDWEVLVDAQSGRIHRAKDMAAYENGTGQVYRPDPLSNASATYGDSGFTDGSDASTTQLYGSG